MVSIIDFTGLTLICLLLIKTLRFIVAVGICSVLALGYYFTQESKVLFSSLQPLSIGTVYMCI